MTPFYGWGSAVSRLEPLSGGSLLFTAKFPEIPDTSVSSDSEGWKAEAILESLSGFEQGTTGLGFQRLNH